LREPGGLGAGGRVRNYAIIERERKCSGHCHTQGFP
jgi:hypothetical protein